MSKAGRWLLHPHERRPPGVANSEEYTITTTQTHDDLQIRELFADQATAMQAKDAERVLSQYAPDVVKFDLAPPLRQSGADALDANALRSWFARFDGPIYYETKELAVSVGDDVAFCHGLSRLSATPEGSPDQFAGCMK